MSIPSTSSSHSTAPAQTGQGGVHCFLVEDSPVIRKHLVEMLEEMIRIRVIGHAEDEAGAVRWMQSFQGPCQLMIVDIFLKGGSGLEVLRAAAKARPDARRVVLSNYATADIRHRCMELGADRVFDKSSELDDLIAYCEELALQHPSGA